MTDLKKAYQRYLDVFPLYWEGTDTQPIPFNSFEHWLLDANTITATYEKEVCKGILHPVTYFLKMNMDQFLGIPHTRRELSHTILGLASKD